MGTREKERERERELKELRRELQDKIVEGFEEIGSPVRDQEKRSEASSEPVLEPKDGKSAVEALLFASPRPLRVAEIKKIVKELSPREIERWIKELQAEYEAQGRAFRVVEVAEGYQIATDRRFSPWIEKLERERKARQATHSALETLAILAYRQPIARAEIEDLRGVDVDSVLGTLLEKGLIRIVGRKEVPGRPYLYGTTERFLVHFGLKSLANLPPLEGIRDLVQKSAEVQGLFSASDQTVVAAESEFPKNPPPLIKGGSQA